MRRGLLAVITEFRFHRDATGAVVADVRNRGVEFWRRYLTAFEKVFIVGRVSSRTADGYPVEQDGIVVHPVTDYRGAVGFFKSVRQLRNEIRIAIRNSDALIVRAPGPLGSLSIREVTRQRKPFALEVVGDPAEVIAVSSRAALVPVRGLLRRAASTQLQRQVRLANGVSYVTAAQLQTRYPPSVGAFTTYYSSLQLHDESFAAAPRPRESFRGVQPVIVCVGRFAQRYKGQHVLLDAIAQCHRNGLDVQAWFVGDGVHRGAAEAQATALGLSGSVRFIGEVNDLADIRNYLDSADMLALPSLTEGLPRVLIEAMARGLPCVASDVGGVSELLGADRRVPPGRPAELATAIARLLSDQDILAADSLINLERAQSYRESVLAERRAWFYSRLRDLLPHSTSRHD